MPTQDLAQTSVPTSAHAPRISGPLPGPKARAIVEADDRWMSPSYTRCYPLVAKRGRGTRVEDVDGNEFLDFAAGIAVVSTGHCHPEVVTAIQQQAAELIHMSGTDFYYEGLVTLAERLSAVAPMPGPHRFYYGNSGAEAIECALKLARYHTGRQNIIAFFGAFHGRTMGALSLTASKPQQKRRFAPLVPGVTHVRYPYAYRGCPGGPRRKRKPSHSGARATSKTEALQDHAAARRSGRHLRGADPGRGRLRRGADHLHAGTAADLRPPRHPAGRRRSAVRRGPHRQVVGDRAFRRAARHRLHGQRHRLRHAARHLHDPRRDHGLDARLARLHLRRQSRIHRRGARHHGRARARRHRQRGEDRRGDDVAPARVGSKRTPS